MPRSTLLIALSILLLTACEEITAPPTITRQPTAKTAYAGQVATFRVAADGVGSPSYQWTRDGQPIKGATRPHYVTPVLTAADDGAVFRCRISNKAGETRSAEARLTLSDAVTISLHEVKAKDGWTLGITRYLPAKPVPSYEPVVMSHGFLENHNVYDLDSECSLAARLAEKGFDVWVLDLRGNGHSAGPKIHELTAWTFSIDDFIHKDAPAAIDHVLAATGKSQVFWVGHSMGGLVGYAYLETQSPEKIKGLITLAGAGWMGGPSQYDPKPGGFFMALASLLGPFFGPDFPFPVGYAWAKGAAGMPWEKALHKFLLGDFGKFTWSPSNMDQASVQLLLDRAVDNTSVNMVRQFLAWTIHEDIYTYGPSPHAPLGQTSEFYDKHGFYSYKDHLNEITTPALLIVGETDQVIPAANVTKIYEALSSTDKTLHVIGTSHGYPVNVGHEDILAGIHSPKLIFPLVIDWLLERAGK